ncbi:MAG: extracellular solute-binding protein [Dechloromonas sp.]|nr:extracellular solute-binding protein [Dechloromonas sp.]
MPMKNLPLTVLACALLASAAVPVTAAPAKAAKPAKAQNETPAARMEIALAHQLGSIGEENLQRLVERYNSSHAGVEIKLVRAAEGDKPAVLNLVRRQDVLEAIAGKAAFKPLHEVMKEAKEAFKSEIISPDLRAGTTDEKGRFFALPVAYSTPVLFYNRNALRKAGLDPDQPPRTWMEVQQTADKLQDAGEKCPYTTSWPVWVHIDNVSALSGVPVATAKGELAFNGLPQVKHVAMLATWHKAKFFRDFGRRNEADKHFLNGECAMITTDSWAHTGFREARGVELGVAPLPHHDDVFGGRQHTLADGASLWIGAGYKAPEYKAAARFVTWLLTPEVQVELARTYGQLPLTDAARKVLKDKVQRDRDVTLDVAYASMKGSGSTHPLRIFGIDPVRLILDEELESVWADTKPAKAALDTAVSRGNAVLSAKPALKKAIPF